MKIQSPVVELKPHHLKSELLSSSNRVTRSLLLKFHCFLDFFFVFYLNIVGFKLLVMFPKHP